MHLSRIDHRPENSIAAPAALHVNVFQAVPCGQYSRQFGPEHGKIFPTPRWLAFGTEEQSGDLAAATGRSDHQRRVTGSDFDRSLTHLANGHLQGSGLEIKIVRQIVEGIT